MAKTQKQPTQKAPVITDEVSTHDEELSKRIDTPADVTPEEFKPEMFDVPITSEMLKANPDMVEGGIKEGDVLQIAAHEADDKTLELLSRYKAAYPANDVLHIATDGQVFLKQNLNDAKNHQKFLTGKVSDLKSYKV